MSLLFQHRDFILKNHSYQAEEQNKTVVIGRRRKDYRPHELSWDAMVAFRCDKYCMSGLCTQACGLNMCDRQGDRLVRL